MAQTNVQAFSGDVEIAGGLSITGSVTSTAGIDKVNLATDGTSANRPVIFTTGTTGAQPLKTDAGITYNPSSNKLTVSGGLSTSVTPGNYLTGSAYDGSTARTFNVDATTTSTASKVVARDASKNVFVSNLYVGDSTTLGITKATGQYGSIKTLGSITSSYEGYAIRDDWVFMSNGPGLAGIYDDTNNKWATKYNALGAVELCHSGTVKLATSSTGVTITGTASATTFSGKTVGTHYGGISGSNAATVSSLTVNNTTQSTSKTTGALIVSGGLGVASNVTANRLWIDDYILHTGDTDTYFGFNDNDHFRIVEGGGVRLQVDSNGRIGIGVEVPAQLLDVAGRIRADTMEIDSYIYHVADDNTYFGFNADDNFRIVEGATVALQVNNNSSIDIQNYIQHAGDTNTYMGFNANDTIVMRTSGSDRITVKSDGRVGIGTVSPDEKLEIVEGSSIKLSGDYNDPTAKLYIDRTGSSSWGTAAAYTAFRFFETRNTSGSEHFNAVKIGASGIAIGYDPPIYTRGGVDSLICSGRVGIGKTDPGHMLDVNGNIKVNNTLYGPGQSRLYFNPNNEPRLYSANSAAFLFATNGYAYATLWVSQSDRRLKKNIEPLKNALDTLKKLNPVHYEKRATESDKCDDECTVEKCYIQEDGFIAQEIQEIPELAHATSHPESNDMLGLNYNAILTYCVKAVQEQQTIIEDEKAKVADLLARVTALENKETSNIA